MNAREKKGCGFRQPQSDRVTVVAWTLTRTSSSFGVGRSTSSSRRTSGGPYLSWTTARMFVTTSPRAGVDGSPRAVVTLASSRGAVGGVVLDAESGGMHRRPQGTANSGLPRTPLHGVRWNVAASQSGWRFSPGLTAPRFGSSRSRPAPAPIGTGRASGSADQDQGYVGAPGVHEFPQTRMDPRRFDSCRAHQAALAMRERLETVGHSCDLCQFGASVHTSVHTSQMTEPAIWTAPPAG